MLSFHFRHYQPEQHEEKTHECSLSILLELKLKKANEAIEKLQLKYSKRSIEINRLRSSLRRTQLSKSNLQATLQDLKQQKLLSEEAHTMLEVIVQ